MEIETERQSLHEMAEDHHCAFEGCHRLAPDQLCNGDGKSHWHGGVHLKVGGGPHRVCDKHWLEDKVAWGPRPWDNPRFGAQA